MKVNLSLSVEDALQLQGFLYDLRHSLSVNGQSMLWSIPGFYGPKYDISQIIQLEDFQCMIAEAVDEVEDHIHYAGCCGVF